MTLDILIPCRSISTGKTRLSPILPPDERANLCRRFLEHMLWAASGTGARVSVVTSDPRVAAIARSAGAAVLEEPGRGLNAALVSGNAQLDAAVPLLVLPTDLPLVDAGCLARVIVPGADVILCPDRRRTGTNALYLSPGARRGFPFSFGAGSLLAHSELCVARGLSLRVPHAPEIAFDIDTPEDFALWTERGGATSRETGRTHEAA